MKKNIYISYIHSDSKNYQFKILDKFKGRKYKFSDIEDLSSNKTYTELELQKVEKKVSHMDVTIVLISRNILNSTIMPLEIKYSLDSTYTKSPKGIIGVVIPDIGNDYGYIMKKGMKGIWRADMSKLPELLSSNTLNEVVVQNKNNINYDSYISIYRWDDFIKDFDNVVKIAHEKSSEFLEDYKITK